MTGSFNPRTPCGVRHIADWKVWYWNMFQSTHSLRSATRQYQDIPKNGFVSIHALLAECDRTRPRTSERWEGFNPRTPCGVRRFHSRRRCFATSFQSTHSLRSATRNYPISVSLLKFQSTHSLRSATNIGQRKACLFPVSIHALLAECDQGGFRHIQRLNVSIHALLAECDEKVRWYRSTSLVSIHALLAECDCARPYTLLLNRANHTLRQPP